MDERPQQLSFRFEEEHESNNFELTIHGGCMVGDEFIYYMTPARQ